MGELRRERGLEKGECMSLCVFKSGPKSESTNNQKKMYYFIKSMTNPAGRSLFQEGKFLNQLYCFPNNNNNQWLIKQAFTNWNLRKNDSKF